MQPKKSLLIVDDVSLMHDLLSSIISKIGGYKIYNALNVTQAKSILKSHVIDILITDIFLNSDSGVDLIREIRLGSTSARKDIPIIAMSGQASVDIVLKAHLLDCNYFIAKPISIKSLTRKLDLVKNLSITVKDSSFYEKIKAEMQYGNVLEMLTLTDVSAITDPDVMLIYTSKAIDNITEEQIQQIVDVSVKNNNQSNLTGAFFYVDGYFLQVLEGKIKDVKWLMEKLSVDVRHQDISVILMSTINHRIFKEWSMAYVKLEGKEIFKQLSFRQNGKGDHSIKDVNINHVINLINNFTSGKWTI